MHDRHAIELTGVSKTYQIKGSSTGSTSASEALVRRLRHPMHRQKTETFNALTDVSFSVPWGEALGIVGRNGAGKSTLLKVLTRITAPSTGRIRLDGRIGSLLEVGTGFHPELTGRENIFLNGTLLGMRRKEIQLRFDEIVAFSGVEKFLDTPVKRYSSGMYVRLAFSVAAHLDTEILAIDEVLAVGDAEFQDKCLGKMQDAAGLGRTVLYVSHQVQSVIALCTSAVFLERGRLVLHGSVEDALAAYRASFERTSLQHLDAARRPGTGEIRLKSVQPTQDTYESADVKVIQYSLDANSSSVGRYFISIHINNSAGMTILQCDSRLVGHWLDPSRPQKGSITVSSPWLKPGRYTVDVFVCKTGILDAWEGAAQFEVLPMLPYAAAASDDGTAQGVVFADFSYESE